MAYQPGFTYVSGPKPRIVESIISSSATFKARNPVSISSVGRTVREYLSTDTVLYGIAMHDASASFAGRTGRCLVEIPNDNTVYAVAVQTGVAASVLSVYQGYAMEKSGNYWRLDTDSVATAPIFIVPREDYSTIDSADSTVFVQFYRNRLIEQSDASVGIAS